MSAPPNAVDIRPPHIILVAGVRHSGKSELIRHLVRNGRSYRVAGLQPAAPRPRPFWSLYSVPKANAYDHLLIELPPTADPRDFIDNAGAGHDTDAFTTSTVICVVNAETMLADFCSHELIRSRIAGLALDDVRSVADVLTEQIEAAQILVLNKADRLSPSQKHGLVALLTALNPEAWLTMAEYGQIPLPLVLGDEALAVRLRAITPGWQHALNGDAFPNAELYAISSLVYRAHCPFHPRRLHEFLGEPWPGVVRSRGIFWIASRPESVAELSQAGAARRYRAVSSWWAATLEGRSYIATDVSEFLGIPWDPTFGDRRQELVFVGIGLDTRALKERLDECLLTENELRRGREQWRSLEDPFPVWAETATARMPELLN
jgi:G3E family GTPase